MDVSLQGKKILITGGTSALGSAFVKKAIAAGAEVYFTWFSNDALCKDLEQTGAKGFRADLRKLSELKTLHSWMQSEAGLLDGLIHNAAVVKDRMIENLTEEDWDKVMDVNLKAAYFLVREFAGLLSQKERARILMIISQVGLHGAFGQANYAASKGGLIALVKSFARELGEKKILVNGLNPGFMKSRMTEDLPTQVIEANRVRSVIGEMSDPEEVADFMVYLMSNRCRRVSGQIFHYDSRPT